MELINRLPVPSLRTYAALSVCALCCSIYYANNILKNGNYNGNSTEIEANGNLKNYTWNFSFKELLECMLEEPICVWTLINYAYCLLIFLGKTIQKLVFGELRASERQHLKDKFWNFVFYKLIFVTGVLNVQYMDEVLMWWAWYTALGFLSLLSQLCKDRFEYLSFSPTTSSWSHLRLLLLLSSIFFLSSFMLLLTTCAAFFSLISFNTFAFTVAECILLGVRTLHVMLRYAVHLYGQRAWEKRGLFTYYMDLTAELIVLAVDFLHHAHMLLWSNIFLSLASLVTCMQLRYLFYEIQRKIARHRNYLSVLAHMEKNYPIANPSDLENADNCAICWERMDSARRLPCSHLFHNNCLQLWLEQETSCPTCRLTFNMSQPEVNVNSDIRRNEHFFHFDASRYVYWLPSFSVEVSHTVLWGNISTGGQLESMARQVQQMFPHYNLAEIMEDLRRTGSVEMTVENILNGTVRTGRVPEMETERESEVVRQQVQQESEVVVEEADISVLEPSTLNSRFSKSSTERERILQHRKALLRMQARRKYLEKHQQLN